MPDAKSAVHVHSRGNCAEELAERARVMLVACLLTWLRMCTAVGTVLMKWLSVRG